MPNQLKQAIGIDIGGTKIDIALVNAYGTIHQSKRIATNINAGPEGIENDILQVIQEMSATTNGFIQGIGIGVAGQIDEESGSVLFGPNLNWHNYPLKQNIQNKAKFPVKIINDVRAIAWSEWLYGAAQGCDDFICMFVGTGIGGAIVRNGVMLKGCSNSCGELGHMTIDFHGPLCTCGNYGCLEAFAGGWAIAKHAQEMVKEEKDPNQILLQLAQQDVSKITAKTVVEAYHKGDALSIHIMDRFKHALAAGCVSIVNAFNPCRLILGGGVLSGVPEFIPLIDSSIKLMALKTATKTLEVVPSKINKEEVGVLGAASIVFNEKFNQGLR